ncbi:MAG: hypothetical protein L0211_14445 [Planctomycetaceae bacterium]|nr:hypothetical protein [Planctomycetaceae bacterium]
MDYFDQIGREWYERAGELARWVMAHLVNRTDVWGRYTRRKSDAASRAVTVPFRDERGKVFLDVDSLTKHFRTRQPSGQLGVHSAGSDLTSRWLAIDIDLHEDDDSLSVSKEGNLAAACGWRQSLVERGLDPLLLDSNGIGGFHLLVVFSEPMSTDSVHQFGAQLVADYEKRGLERKPEVFPDKPTWDRYGDWLRLPGRHHTRPHYTRVWNDEPFAESPWLEGHEAIDRILATRPAATQLLEQLGLSKLSRTVCLDFDGVLHSYRSGWRGAQTIPDPPIHGTREAVARLRQTYRVVVYSARCRTVEGRRAVENWLRTHDIQVDEVCDYKPPSLVYVDDRAIRFRGDWEQTITDIQQFRK